MSYYNMYVYMSYFDIIFSDKILNRTFQMKKTYIVVFSFKEFMYPVSEKRLKNFIWPLCFDTLKPSNNN